MIYKAWGDIFVDACGGYHVALGACVEVNPGSIRSSNAGAHSTRKYIERYLLREGLPARLRAANPPCRFIPLRCGMPSIPFDFLHSSLREPREPCVETLPDDTTDGFCSDVSRSITSVESYDEAKIVTRSFQQTFATCSG